MCRLLRCARNDGNPCERNIGARRSQWNTQSNCHCEEEVRRRSNLNEHARYRKEQPQRQSVSFFKEHVKPCVDCFAALAMTENSANATSEHGGRNGILKVT